MTEIPEKIAIDANTRKVGSEEQSFNDVDPSVFGRKFMTKLDLRLIPVLGLTYTILFLDRTNIANARIAGLEKGLDMPSNGYNTALWIFYIPFVLSEAPSNMLFTLPWVKPNIFLALNMFILGVVSMCQGLTATYGGLLALRFLMGIFEATLPAGAAFLIASYYTRREQSVRFALFFMFGILGPCFSGLLAYAIMVMNGTSGRAGWQWIFILEGIITIVCSAILVLFVPHFPEKAHFLTATERENLLMKLRADRGDEKADIRNEPWLKVVFDYKIWLPVLLFFCCDMTAASISSFMPTILTELGWKARHAQVMTIPVWITGIIVSLLGSFASGRIGIRFPFIMGGFTLSLIGWIIMEVYVPKPGVRYFALFCMSGGTFIIMSLSTGWMANNLRGKASLGVGTALILGLGNCANFVASNVFITKEKPRYHTGFATGLSLTVVGWVLALSYGLILIAHNKRLEKKRAQTGNYEDTQAEYKYVF